MKIIILIYLRFKIQNMWRIKCTKLLIKVKEEKINKTVILNNFFLMKNQNLQIQKKSLKKKNIKKKVKKMKKEIFKNKNKQIEKKNI